MQKLVCEDFGPQNGSKIDPGGPTNEIFAQFFALDSRMAPRPPKMGSSPRWASNPAHQNCCNLISRYTPSTT
eukprot:12418132-Karenia_brevis.AAC.1